MRRGTAAAIHNLVKLLFRNPASAEILSDRAKNFVKRFVSQQVPLNQCTDIFRGGLSHMLGLFFDRPQLSWLEADVLEGKGSHSEKYTRKKYLLDRFYRLGVFGIGR